MPSCNFPLALEEMERLLHRLGQTGTLFLMKMTSQSYANKSNVHMKTLDKDLPCKGGFLRVVCLMLEVSAFECLYSGQFTLSTQEVSASIKNVFGINSLTTALEGFLWECSSFCRVH